MRHDWNSLLSDDESLLMTKYSKQFFPDADILVSVISFCSTLQGWLQFSFQTFYPKKKTSQFCSNLNRPITFIIIFLMED